MANWIKLLRDGLNRNTAWKNLTENSDNYFYWKQLKHSVSKESLDERSKDSLPKDFKLYSHAYRLMELALAAQQQSPVINGEPITGWERIVWLSFHQNALRKVNVNVAFVTEHNQYFIACLSLEMWPEGSGQLVENQSWLSNLNEDSDLNRAIKQAWNSSLEYLDRVGKLPSLDFDVSWHLQGKDNLPMEGESLGGAAFWGFCRLLQQGQFVDSRILIAAAFDENGGFKRVESISRKVQAIHQYNQSRFNGIPPIDKIIVAHQLNCIQVDIALQNTHKNLKVMLADTPDHLAEVRSYHTDLVIDYLKAVTNHAEQKLNKPKFHLDLGWNFIDWNQQDQKIIWGDIGSGKSMILASEATRLAKVAKDKILQGQNESDQLIPLYLVDSLDTLLENKRGKKDKIEDLHVGIVDNASLVLANPHKKLKAFLGLQLKSNNCVVLMDDYHGIYTALREKIATTLSRLVKTPKLRLLVCSRHFSGSSSYLSWLSSVELKPITKKQLDSYIGVRLSSTDMRETLEKKIHQLEGLANVPLVIGCLADYCEQHYDSFKTLDILGLYELCLDAFRQHSDMDADSWQYLVSKITKAGWHCYLTRSHDFYLSDLADICELKSLKNEFYAAIQTSGFIKPSKKTSPRERFKFIPAIESCLPLLHSNTNPSLSSFLTDNGNISDKRILSNYLTLIGQNKSQEYVPSKKIKFSESYFSNKVGYLVAREQELGLLNVAWRDTQINVLSIYGMEGVGQSSLVSHWIQNYDLGEGLDDGLAWSFRDTSDNSDTPSSSNRFFDEAFQHFGKKGPQNTWDKGKYLAKKIGKTESFDLEKGTSKGRNLLILDRIDAFQDEHGNIKDRAMKSLLEGLCDENSQVLCIITSRLPVKVSSYTASPRLTKFKMDALSKEDAYKLLEKIGVSPEQESFIKWHEKVKGLPLALNFMGHFLKNAKDVTIDQLNGFLNSYDKAKSLQDHSESVSDEKLEEKFWINWFIEQYNEWMYNNGMQHELALLRLMGVFLKTITVQSLLALCQNPLYSLTEPVHSTIKTMDTLQKAEVLKGYIKNLESYGWVDYLSNGEIQINPLIREYYRKYLINRYPLEWFELNHLLLKEFRYHDFIDNHQNPEGVGEPVDWNLDQKHEELSKLITKAKKKNLYRLEIAFIYDEITRQTSAMHGLIEMRYWAVAHGCMAGLYQEAYNVYATTTHYAHLYDAISTELNALKRFFTKDWTPLGNLTYLQQAKLCGSIAFCHESEENLAKAIAFSQRQYELACKKEFEDSEKVKMANEALSACNKLVELKLVMGQLGEAKKLAETAISSTLHNNKSLEIQSYAYLASLQHRMGLISESESNFKEAEQRQASWHNNDKNQNEYLAHTEGARYWAFLIDTRDFSKDLRKHIFLRCDRAQRISNTDASDKALYRLTWGRYFYAKYVTYQRLNYLNRSEQELNKAMDEMNYSPRRDFMPRILWMRSLVLRSFPNDQDRLSKALTDADEVLKIATRTGMMLYAVEALLLIGNIKLDHIRYNRHQKNVFWGDIGACYKEAEKLISDTQYNLRIPELYLLSARIQLYEYHFDHARKTLDNAKTKAIELNRYLFIRFCEFLEQEFDEVIAAYSPSQTTISTSYMRT